MGQSEIYSVFEKLFELTQSKKLQWRKIEDNHYKIDFPKSSILLWMEESPEDPSYVFGLNIINQRGDYVDKMVSNSTDYPNGAEKLERLFDLVTRNYLKADETIQDILAGLKAKELEPEEEDDGMPF